MELNYLNDFFDIFLADLIISFVTILLFFMQKKQINSIVGYRTSNSMKNQRNWDFAQKFYFRYWLLAIPLVILFQITLLFIFQIDNTGLIETLSMVLFFIYSIILIFITERKLKKLTS
ncbi:MAG: SdpI family protein [Sphingobacterium sp.]